MRNRSTLSTSPLKFFHQFRFTDVLCYITLVRLQNAHTVALTWISINVLSKPSKPMSASIMKALIVPFVYSNLRNSVGGPPTVCLSVSSGLSGLSDECFGRKREIISEIFRYLTPHIFRGTASTKWIFFAVTSWSKTLVPSYRTIRFVVVSPRSLFFLEFRQLYPRPR